MPNVDLKIARGETFELSEAFQAMRELDLLALDIINVDARINLTWAAKRLDDIEERRQMIRRHVAAALA